MARRTHTEEFRIEAVKQVTENGYEVADTAHRLGVHPHSLRSWIKRKYTITLFINSRKNLES